MKTETIDTLAKVGNTVTLTGGSMSAISLWIASNALGITGAIIALLGVLVNIHYRRKASERAYLAHLRHEAATAAQVQAIREESARRDMESKARLAMRQLQMDLMRSGVLPRDFTASDLAPLEMPTNFPFQEGPSPDEEGDDGQ